VFTEYGVTNMTTATGYVDAVSTLFDCTYHINDIVMSYVVRVYDMSGTLLVCEAYGDDPQGMIDGDYDTWGNTINYADVSPKTCTAR